MNQSVIYLMDELCAGVEIYYTGRTGGQYFKTAFLLCDDYTELVSKLFLLTDNTAWSDKRANGSFKNYPEILKEVEHAVNSKLAQHATRVKALQTGMTARRRRRNDFFHSTSLLDLSVSQRNCVESFCDLFDYGEILFASEWRDAIGTVRNLETLAILLRLEKIAFSDPSITPRLNHIIQACPRNIARSARRGVHLTLYPEDLHLRLCISWGGLELHDKLKALLATVDIS